jgi:hypothetical protein
MQATSVEPLRAFRIFATSRSTVTGLSFGEKVSGFRFQVSGSRS